MTRQLCRWGILGAANIAKKNWQAIHNSGNGTLVAVGSRDQRRGAEWVAECQAHVPFGSVPRVVTYDELLANDTIQAVYIPLPTGIRKEWVLKAAAAGKHVLCEKPCAPKAADLAEMIDACAKNNVQFMDGVMFMHSARLPLLRDALDDGLSVGAIKRIASQFSFYGGDDFQRANIRVNSDLEPLGALGDLGWYNIRFTLFAMKYQMPQRVTGRILTATSDGVPLEFSGELFFPGGVSASFYCSFLTENQQWANISGDRGTLTLPDFVLPFFGGEAGFNTTRASFEARGCEFNMVEHSRRVVAHEYSNNQPNSQETLLFRNFAAFVLSDQRDEHWPTIALQTQQVLDACLRSSRDNSRVVELG